jgi:hypothetical protein
LNLFICDTVLVLKIFKTVTMLSVAFAFCFFDPRLKPERTPKVMNETPLGTFAAVQILIYCVPNQITPIAPAGAFFGYPVQVGDLIHGQTDRHLRHFAFSPFCRGFFAHRSPGAGSRR